MRKRIRRWGRNEFTGGTREARDWYLGRIEPQTSRLMENEVSHANMVAALLASSNGGGAVAVLAYIAQLDTAGTAPASMGGAPYVLGLYLAGFFLALVLAVGMYYASLSRVIGWVKGARAFYAGTLRWRALWDNRKEPWWGGGWLHVAGWLSIICFFAASVMGISTVFDAAQAREAQRPIPRANGTSPAQAPKTTTIKTPRH